MTSQKSEIGHNKTTSVKWPILKPDSSLGIRSDAYRERDICPATIFSVTFDKKLRFETGLWLFMSYIFCRYCTLFIMDLLTTVNILIGLRLILGCLLSGF